MAGLVVSQFITLYITPAIYLYLERFQERVLDRVAFFRAGHARPVPAAAGAGLGAGVGAGTEVIE